MFGSPFKPMEPVLWPTPFNDPDWLFQPKWDGVRLLAHLDKARVCLFSKRGRDRTAQYPELVRALPGAFRGTRAVIDGEVVVFWDGKTSFPRVMQRELATRPEIIKGLVRSLPANYMAFDLVHLDGRDLLQFGFEERQALLRQHLLLADTVLLTDSFPQHGDLLFEAVRERGWEGIVAKRRGSFYWPGGKSEHWRKVKVRRQQLCAVGGYTVTSRGLGSLLLGVYRAQDLLYAGRVSSGLTEEHLGLLQSHLARMISRNCPFTPVPRLPGLEIRWVKPVLTVLIEFSEWTDGLQLRHPVVRGFTADPVTACKLP